MCYLSVLSASRISRFAIATEVTALNRTKTYSALTKHQSGLKLTQGTCYSALESPDEHADYRRFKDRNRLHLKNGITYHYGQSALKLMRTGMREQLQHAFDLYHFHRRAHQISRESIKDLYEPVVAYRHVRDCS